MNDCSAFKTSKNEDNWRILIEENIKIMKSATHREENFIMIPIYILIICHSNYWFGIQQINKYLQFENK
jgi:hypothetical protein